MAAKESFFNSPPVKIKRELKGSCVFQLDLIFSIKSKREGKRKKRLNWKEFVVHQSSKK